MDEEIEIPYAPRQWAKKLHSSKKRWASLVLHRRAGKTTAILNHHQRAAMDDEWERERLIHQLPTATQSQIDALMAKRRIYWHVMPTLKQAKTVAWDILKDISAPIPGAKPNNSELFVHYPNGNKVYLVGADDPDSLRGPALAGLSLDEYSQINGRVFGEILSKALGDRVGYCIWAGTLKGEDQLFKNYQTAKDDPDWYAVWQDIDTSMATETGATVVALQKALEDDLKLVAKGEMTRDQFDQEWYLSTAAAIQGAWYRTEIAAAMKEGRITEVPWDPALPVDTDWDIGMVDAATVIYSQSHRSGMVAIIDYEEAEGEALPYFVKKMKERPYTYGKHYPPHDAAVKDFGTGKSVISTAKELGLKFEYPVQAPSVIDGINAGRLLMAKCWFDAKKCARLIECLRQYRKTFNPRLGVFTGVPVHDQFSHGADAYRGLAVRHKTPVDKPKGQNVPPVSRSYEWA